MSHIIRILFALQISVLFVAGCAVDEDDAADTELAVDDIADEAVATPDVPELALDGVAADDAITAQAAPICTRLRLNNRATFATCRSTCASRGQNALGFDNTTKICRCCSAGPL